MSQSEPNDSFSEEQKQYLAGFTMGSDIARAVNGLPVLSNSAANGTMLQIGGAQPKVDGEPIPTGPERIAYLAQSETLAQGKKLSKEEVAKREKNPLDMWDEMVARSDAGEFPRGTDVFLQKFHGLFYVAPNQDAYMMRLRIPGGLMRGWQLRGLADLSEETAGGYIDITTRANLQLREIPANGAKRALYGIRELDLVSLGSGGDNIRNCTASCLSGIDPDELIETIPLAKRMHHYILNHREMYGLPRKFNIAFEGGGKIASLEDTNDIGFRAVQVTAPQPIAEGGTLEPGVYFLLTLGGITGHKDFARGAGVLLTPDETLKIAGAIVRVFVKHGDRTDRKKARLKYLLDAWGFDKFLEAVEEEMGSVLTRVSEDAYDVPAGEDRMAHVGVHPQKQPDRLYVGVVFPVGRMTAAQARELSSLADQYGNGEIRLSVWQNLIIPNIRAEDVDAVTSRIEACGLEWQASSFRAGLVACTGSAGCKYAGADTKANAMTLARHLESCLELDVPINIHLTGCHHSCAQHYIGDIGLQACQVEVGDDMVDGYDLVVGGGWGERQGIARPLYQSLPFPEVPPIVAALVRGYLDEREQGEDFVNFARRMSDDALKDLVSARAAAS